MTATPLRKAAKHGSFTAFMDLIHAGAKTTDLDRHKNTLLHYATHRQAGSLPLVEFLLDHDVDVNAPNCYGQTPLHHSIWSPDMVRLLFSRGADVNVKDVNGQTVLHLAVNEKP